MQDGEFNDLQAIECKLLQIRTSMSVVRIVSFWAHMPFSNGLSGWFILFFLFFFLAVYQSRNRANIKPELSIVVVPPLCSPCFLGGPHVSPVCSLGHILTTVCLKLSWKYQNNRPQACLLPVWAHGDQQLRKWSAVCALTHSHALIL